MAFTLLDHNLFYIISKIVYIFEGLFFLPGGLFVKENFERTPTFTNQIKFFNFFFLFKIDKYVGVFPGIITNLIFQMGGI